MMPLGEVLTTGQVAGLLRVTTNTVSKWFDAGLMDGFKHPGSSTRRISKNEFIKFVEKHDIPLLRLQKEAVLTTAQCARLCFVTVNTITKWIDLGLLTGFSLGTERRLIFHRDLIRFMRDRKIPLSRVGEIQSEVEAQMASPEEKRSKRGRKPGGK